MDSFARFVFVKGTHALVLKKRKFKVAFVVFVDIVVVVAKREESARFNDREEERIIFLCVLFSER